MRRFDAKAVGGSAGSVDSRKEKRRTHAIKNRRELYNSVVVVVVGGSCAGGVGGGGGGGGGEVSNCLLVIDYRLLTCQ